MATIPHSGAILIVDDDRAEVELISIAIRNMNLPFRIDVAFHGLAALDYLYARGNFLSRPRVNPALVILDNKMSVMSGVDALREIRLDKSFHSMPVVMFTASANDDDVADAYAAGVNSYVVKPTGAKNFTGSIHAIVNYWTQTNAACR